MSSNKKYYWLKLNEKFFDEDTILWLEEQENGKDYVIFYLKLCLKSLQDDGKLIRYVGEKLIPYDIKALGNLTNTPVDTVAVAMKTFIEIGLVERLDTGEIYLTQINELIGSETEVAKRVRKHRAKQTLIEQQSEGLLQSNNAVTKSNTEIDIEIEKDIEKDIDKERGKKEEASKQEVSEQTKKKSPYGDFNNVFLTDDEYSKLARDYTDYEDRIQKLSYYIESTGKKYKSHYATVKSWARNEKKKTKQDGRLNNLLE